MRSSDVGLEEVILVDDPFLPVCHVLSDLMGLGLGQLNVVVLETGDPLVQQVVGAAHLLGLFSNQVLLHFFGLVVG